MIEDSLMWKKKVEQYAREEVTVWILQRAVLLLRVLVKIFAITFDSEGIG